MLSFVTHVNGTGEALVIVRSAPMLPGALTTSGRGNDCVFRGDARARSAVRPLERGARYRLSSMMLFELIS
jgi:hypothetical protein